MTAEQYARDYLGVKKDSASSKVQPAVVKKEEAPPVTPAVAPAAASLAQPTAAPVPPPAKTSDPTPQSTPSEPQMQKPIADWRIVGEVFHSYIIVETGDKMLVIDQHAAHERLLYEQLRARLHETAPTSQLLLVPLEVMMMSDEVTALCEYQKELEAIGFAFTASRNALEVTALPEGVSPETASDMLCTIADRIKTNTGSARLTRDILFERALYQGACKAAIKAGRQYAPEHLEWLVEQLMKLPDITVCPHGRPVAMQMSKQNLDHQFERS
jgi:DNA mismatch repair protein MutL